MEFTGERFVPSEAGVIAYEHWHRYAVAAAMVAGKRVLDVACGEGYGAALLAGSAAEVVGLDSAADAVSHASRTYAGTAGLSFQQATLPALGLEDASFDAVVCFETLEHVPDAAAALTELKRVLRPGGLLIASTPDRAVYSGKQGNRNAFHTHEMDRAEFEALCRAHFQHVGIVGQKIYLASVIGSVSPAQAPTMDCFGFMDGHAVRGLPAIADATYLLSFCSDAPLPAAAATPSLLLDNDAAQDERETLMGWAQTTKRERDAATGESRTLAAERDVIAEQAERVRHERDVLAEENMDLTRLLKETVRTQQKAEEWRRDAMQRLADAMQRMAGELAELRSDAFVDRVAFAADRSSADRQAVETFITTQVVAPLRVSREDLAEQLAALGRLRSLDLEAVGSALNHDRVVLETVHAWMAENGALRAAADRMRCEVDAVRESASWRLTGPLRALSQVFKRSR